MNFWVLSFWYCQHNTSPASESFLAKSVTKLALQSTVKPVTIETRVHVNIHTTVYDNYPLDSHPEAL